MAEKPSEEGGAPSGKKTKLLLFVVIGLLVIVLGGGAAAFFMIKKKSAAAADEEGADEPTQHVASKHSAKKDHPDAPPVFVKLEPFTVKLQVEQQDSYLQVQPELRVLDAPVSERVKQYTPAIRHKVLLILSGKRASELSTPQGVQQLANEIRVAINLIIDGPKVTKKKGKVVEETPEISDEADPGDSVQSVLFTSFIIQ
jgi:flagellar FliL protein